VGAQERYKAVGEKIEMESTIEFSKYSQRADLPFEKEGAVCSFCGARLQPSYYLLLTAWRPQTKEIVSPSMRFCPDCWGKIEGCVYTQVRQLKMPIERS